MHLLHEEPWRESGSHQRSRHARIYIAGENTSAREVPAPWPAITDENAPELEQDKQASLAYRQDKMEKGQSWRKC